MQATLKLHLLMSSILSYPLRSIDSKCVKSSLLGRCPVRVQPSGWKLEMSCKLRHPRFDSH